MRILHTSDWHLGQTLHEVSREFEHRRFLSWLLDTLVAQEVDALLITGDIFDCANPPPQAQRAYYEFLAHCRECLPALSILVIGGNHDSAGRLDAPRSVLRAVGVTAIGGLPLLPDGEVDAEQVIVPLRTRGGRIGAWVLAVPFLRRADLPMPALAAAGAPHDGGEIGARLIAGVRGLYHGLYARAKALREPGQAILATGHCFLSGGQVSEESERQIQFGNQALPIDVFPTDLAYVALGHLHFAQPVGGFAHVRYAGSPIPLSLAEKDYQHQVVVLDLEGERLVRARTLLIPRFVPMQTVPEMHMPLPIVLSHLRALPRVRPADALDEERPYLEVRVLRERDLPLAGMREEIERALTGAWARLLRIHLMAGDPEVKQALGDQVPERNLKEMDPVEVFQRCYERQFDDDAPEELMVIFHELLDSVRQEAAA